MDEDKKFLRELYRENSLFLNKAMLAIPSVFAPLLLGFLFKENSMGVGINVLKYLIMGGATCFLIAVLTLLHSCFTTEKAINTFDAGDFRESEQLNEKVGKKNKIAYWLIVIGFFVSCVGVFSYQIMGMHIPKRVKMNEFTISPNFYPANPELVKPISIFHEQKLSVPVSKDTATVSEKNTK